MYKIYADDTLIYDSTLEDYKISKGSISLEVNKSGSFSFAIYPDHFYYDKFIRLKTVITVYKSGKIVFRGRILNDVTDYWNNKSITCEGELGFLQDSIIRPFSFSGTPEQLFYRLISSHNSQVDEFKKFKIGTVTVVDPNTNIARSNTDYESTFSNLNSNLIENTLGGYLYITHGEDGTDPIPTINYLADFTKVSSQKIEFGSNLKNYTKTVKATDFATAVIPLGYEMDDGDDSTDNQRLTIKSINDGKDYLYDEEGVALYGWIFKTVIFDDVTGPFLLRTKGKEYLESILNQNITIEIDAIDLHLLDPSIESINVGEYVQVSSTPHNFQGTFLCSRQTIDILKPESDSYTLGHTYASFTEASYKVQSGNEKLTSAVNRTATQLNQKVGRDENDQIVNMLNISEEVIELNSNRLVIKSDKFELDADGSLRATDVTLKNELGDFFVEIGDGIVSVGGKEIFVQETVRDFPIMNFRAGDHYYTLCVRCGFGEHPDGAYDWIPGQLVFRQSDYNSLN